MDFDTSEFGDSVSMPGQAWRVQVAEFMDVTVDGMKHEEAVSKLTKVPLLELVQGLDAELTTEDSHIRARATLLLSEVVTASANLNYASAVQLGSFFTARLPDWVSVRGSLKGTLHLLRAPPSSPRTLPAQTVASIAHTLLTNVAVQALVQADRMLWFECMLCILEAHLGALEAIGEELCQGLVAGLQDEKDPRCLFLPRAEGGGGADPAVLRALGRELGEAVCCYFPVSFRPPPGDVRGISRADLAGALTSAMAGEGAWAEVVVPLAL
eukprot:CAMPEP_0114316000 /NCGR_PEP_ID=MMETSP0059-20121206/22936_1 /TAXON_ID=36894 /ORGANISM="Pyramimonas parkeae, Strain CCMP726" /LENGTH=268 /DNA_ID=CAMNT_0001441835 /DNA_START=1 /DNA_END=804 /DNA_ORIENTATION=-